MDRQEQGDSCCSNSKTEECRRACLDIFRTNLTPNQQQRDLVEEACEVTSPKVLDCIKNYTKVTPATDLEERKWKKVKTISISIVDMYLFSISQFGWQKKLCFLIFNSYNKNLLVLFLQFTFYLFTFETRFSEIYAYLLADMHCCSKSNKSRCREACNEVLQKATTFQEMLDGLEFGGCGAPLPQVRTINPFSVPFLFYLPLQEQFWQCFMKPSAPAVSNRNEVSRIELVGLDSAKWHCCQSTSNSSQCRNLCSKIFTKEWSTMWEEFHQKCLTKISEEALRNCLDEGR